MINDSWNRFIKTGRVEDYLEYACTREGSQKDKTELTSGKEGSFIDRAGKANGDGADINPFRRL